MKNFIAAIVCIVFFITGLHAQKDIPAFGKVEIAELQKTTCDFDKAAEAEVLFDVAELYCSLDLNSDITRWSTEIERHVRIKILNTKGLKFADIHIPYMALKNLEEIKNISAQTINLDAAGNIVITKVDKKLIYDKKINKREAEIVFAFPDVKPGSIIEYKYRDKVENYVVLKNWFFQKAIPVKLSRYTLNFPVQLTISALPRGGLYMTKKESTEGDRNIKSFTMTEVPALRDEAFITCDEDYWQQVVPFMIALELPGQFRRTLQRTWPAIIKELLEDEDFGVQLNKNIPRTSDLDALLKNMNDPYQKMVTIYDYVRKNMHWDDYYSIWAEDGVKAAWKDKKGTSSEINLILVNLLKDADLKADPVLLSTRDNGRVSTSIAGYQQFNHVMAYVTIGKRNYVLDATDSYTPAQLIPPDVLYSEGLVIEKQGGDHWGWNFLEDKDHSFDNLTNIEATIDDKGIMHGVAQIMSKDYSRLLRAPKLKEGKEKFIESYFTSSDNNIKIDSLQFQNEQTDSLPLIQDFKFTEQLNNSGAYNYFSANLFTGLEKNPFIGDTRFSDIFFGAKQVYTVNGFFKIPDGYTFDELPKSTRMRLPDTSIVFTRYVSADGNTLSVRMLIEFKKPVYAAEEYDGFHEFYKKLYSILNEQFVYKKM